MTKCLSQSRVRSQITGHWSLASGRDRHSMVGRLTGGRRNWCQPSPQSLSKTCPGGPEVNELVSAIFHSIVFYRCYGKFHYKHEDSYSIGTLGYEEVSCDYLDFTYVRISSQKLIENINREIKEFVDKLRQESSQSNGSISLEFYSRRRGRWPFNDAPLVWEIWTVKVNCDKTKDASECPPIEELLLEKLVTIIQIMNSSKCYLPQMPNQQHSDTIFETNYVDVQPYIFKISHKVGSANSQLTASPSAADGSTPSAIKKFIKETLAL